MAIFGLFLVHIDGFQKGPFFVLNCSTPYIIYIIIKERSFSARPIDEMSGLFLVRVHSTCQEISNQANKTKRQSPTTKQDLMSTSPYFNSSENELR